MIVGCHHASFSIRKRSPAHRWLPSASVGFRRLPSASADCADLTHEVNCCHAKYVVLGLSYAWNGCSELIAARRCLQFVHAPCQLAGLQCSHLPRGGVECCALLYSTMSHYGKLPTASALHARLLKMPWNVQWPL